MFLLYLDASGTPEQQDVNSKHYVWVGVCMHEGSWFGLDKRLQTLQAKYAFPGVPFELHVKQFAVTIKEQEKIPNFEELSRTDRRERVLEVRCQLIDAEQTPEAKRKRRDKYKETDPFVHLSRRERSQLLEDAVDVIAGHEKVKLFGEAIDKSHPQVKGAHIDPVRQAFTQVVARFDKYLQMRHTWKLQGGGRPAPNQGLLILDKDESTEATLHNTFNGFRRHGHVFGEMRHVIDVPFFAPSDRVGGLQLADVGAYVVRRYLDTGAKAGSHEERQFLKLFQRFDRDSYGRLHGLRHYTPSGGCACRICSDRGHAPRPQAAPTG